MLCRADIYAGSPLRLIPRVSITSMKPSTQTGHTIERSCSTFLERNSILTGKSLSPAIATHFDCVSCPEKTGWVSFSTTFQTGHAPAFSYGGWPVEMLHGR